MLAAATWRHALTPCHSLGYADINYDVSEAFHTHRWIFPLKYTVICMTHCVVDGEGKGGGDSIRKKKNCTTCLQVAQKGCSLNFPYVSSFRVWWWSQDLTYIGRESQPRIGDSIVQATWDLSSCLRDVCVASRMSAGRSFTFLICSLPAPSYYSISMSFISQNGAIFQLINLIRWLGPANYEAA